MSWESGFVKRLALCNLGLFGFAYYMNTLEHGEILRPVKERTQDWER